MGGTSLAVARRARTPLFTDRVFVGRAIDIGAGPDPIRLAPEFPQLRDVREWDLQHGDATVMRDVAPESYDLVYSSHCLEHIADPLAAFARWWELVKVGGHLVVVVPDENLYERLVWPPTRNGDHEWTFSTLASSASARRTPKATRVQQLIEECRGGLLISLLLLEDGFDPDDENDQTATGRCECGIELVVRKLAGAA